MQIYCLSGLKSIVISVESIMVHINRDSCAISLTSGRLCIHLAAIFIPTRNIQNIRCMHVDYTKADGRTDGRTGRRVRGWLGGLTGRGRGGGGQEADGRTTGRRRAGRADRLQQAGLHVCMHAGM